MNESDAQLRSVLNATVEFLYAQGCGEASAAVAETLRRLERPSPLNWELRDDENREWRITLIDVDRGYAAITQPDAPRRAMASGA